MSLEYENHCYSSIILCQIKWRILRLSSQTDILTESVFSSDVQSGVEVGPNFGGGDIKVDVEDQAMEEEDEDGDEVRPDLTWNQLIAQAIYDDGVEKRASLLDIYKSIEDR